MGSRCEGGLCQAARTTSGLHSDAKAARTASRMASCSEEKAKCTGLPGKLEDPARDDIALDLIGAGIDGPGKGEEEVV
jgi:hypothetical protein